MGAPPKKGGSGALIAVFAVLGLLVLGGLGVGAYLLFGGGTHYDSVAHEHLPKDCEAVIRIDIEGLTKVPAIKEHVIPAIDEKAKESEDASKMARFLLTAELNPKKDLSELVICVTNIDPSGDEPDVIAVVGGHLLENGIIDAIAKHGKKDKFKKPVEEDGLKIIETKDEPVFVTQAGDAALVISNRKKLLKKATKTGKAFEDYDIPLDEQIVGIIPADTVRELAKSAGRGLGLGSQLDDAGRIILTVTLDPGKIGGRLEMPSKRAAKELATMLNESLNAMKQMPGGAAAFGDPMAAAMLSGAKIKSKGKELVIEVAIPDKLIEKFAKEIAKGIREADEEI